VKETGSGNQSLVFFGSMALARNCRRCCLVLLPLLPYSLSPFSRCRCCCIPIVHIAVVHILVGHNGANVGGGPPALNSTHDVMRLIYS
jgi:hypothetical protein